MSVFVSDSRSRPLLVSLPLRCLYILSTFLFSVPASSALYSRVRERQRAHPSTHIHMRKRTDPQETDRKINLSRGEDELIRTRDERESTVTLRKPGNVGKPPGIDMEVLVRLPIKSKRGEHTCNTSILKRKVNNRPIAPNVNERDASMAKLNCPRLTVAQTPSTCFYSQHVSYVLQY